MPKKYKRLTTDEYIFRSGGPGGDWSFDEVVEICEHEHRMTVRAIKDKEVKDNVPTTPK